MNRLNGTQSASRRSQFTFLIGFNLFYLILATWQVQRSANMEFLLYIGVVLLAIIFIFFLNQKFQFTMLSLWAMSLWGLLHMAGGLMEIPQSWPTGAPKKVLYNLWLFEDALKFDQFVHAFGFGMTTWLVWQIIKRYLKAHTIPTTSVGGWLLLCVFVSLGLGSINEIVEFFATLFMPETNVGGYYNTGFDLVFNAIGAFSVAAAIYFLDRN